MEKVIIDTRGVAAAHLSLSQAVQGGGVLLLAGQTAIDADGTVRGSTIEEQTRQTLDNLDAILGAAGKSRSDVLKCTVYLRDFAHYEAYDAIYRDFFSDPKPARTTVGAQLWGPLLIEIDVIAIA